MEVNELRVGNFVWEEYGGLYEVININSEGFGYVDLRKPTFKCIGRYEIGSVKPIPLTKEWLLKLGIQYSDFEGLFQIGGYDIDAKDGSYCHFYFNEYGDWYKEIEYVHQLQNLYFALTGEELKLK